MPETVRPPEVDRDECQAHQDRRHGEQFAEDHQVMCAFGIVLGLRAWLALFARAVRATPRRWRVVSEQERTSDRPRPWRPVAGAAPVAAVSSLLYLAAELIGYFDAGRIALTILLVMIKKGIVYTPDLSAGALDGITRNTILAICADLGLKLVEKRITRDEVYICDEAFFTGTAAEVTPIRELDRIELGTGSRGPITERIQSAFFDIVNGRNAKYAEWLTKV